MPTPTYDLIEEKVLGSAQASVTFSSIPGTYKDLVLEVYVPSVTVNQNVVMAFNGDTAANYSKTLIWGDGTSASSLRQTAQNGVVLEAYAYPRTNSYAYDVAEIMSYANSNVKKTTLVRAGNAGNAVEATDSLWNSTAAITSFTLSVNSGSMASGSTFRLWGVAG